MQVSSNSTPTNCKDFCQTIKHYYSGNRRNFSWRDQHTPYRIVVSEIMLQQTQTDRVAQKFDSFIERFPDFEALAQAALSSVLHEWSGLGYNRRALFLQKTAAIIQNTYAGKLPDDPNILRTLPGIGPATACSIVTFAFNKPTVFIETNIRTVFIYFFFKNQTQITDAQIEPLVRQTLDHENPREWYYALMDYGTMLKKTFGNVSRNSAHYQKQSRFEGSDRQIRSHIIRILLENNNSAPVDLIHETFPNNPERIKKILDDLCKEGFMRRKNEDCYEICM